MFRKIMFWSSLKSTLATVLSVALLGGGLTTLPTPAYATGKGSMHATQKATQDALLDETQEDEAALEPKIQEAGPLATTLPAEVLVNIASYLKPNEYMDLRRTGRFFRDLLKIIHPVTELFGNQIPIEFRDIGDGRAWLIIGMDKSGIWHAFILSQEFPPKPDGKLYSHYEAAGAIDEKARAWLDEQGLPHQGMCDGKGSLMSKGQLEALAHALGRPERFDNSKIGGQLGPFMWSWLVLADVPGSAFVLDGFGYVVHVSRGSQKESVRCALPVRAY